MANTVSTARQGRSSTRALLAAYLIVLAWVILWKLELPYLGGELRVVKLVPFASDGTSGSSSTVEVLINLLLFVPFGMLLAVCAPAWNWLRALLPIAATSLACEVAQYALRLGSSDITDLIVNCAGGAAGFGAARLLARSSAVVAARAARVLASAFIALALFFALSPISYAPMGNRPQASAQASPAAFLD